MKRLLVILLASGYIVLGKVWAVNPGTNDHLSQIVDDAQKCIGNFSIHGILRKCETTVDSSENATVNISKKELNHRALVEQFKSLWPVKDWEENGLFTESYLDLMNEHWLKFPPPPPQVQITLGLTYMVLNGVGGLGNLLVIFMYHRKYPDLIRFILQGVASIGGLYYETKHHMYLYKKNIYCI